MRLLEKDGGRSGAWRREPGRRRPVADAPAASERGVTGLPRGTVVSVNVAAEKGVRKAPRGEIELRVGHGVEGDGHAGPWHRQVSLLAQESIDTMRAKGLDVGPGDFAENVTTRGIEVYALPLGTRLTLGPCLVEVTQIGKVCHDRCAIYRAAGDCVMPREGIFVASRGRSLRPGDEVRVVALGRRDDGGRGRRRHRGAGGRPQRGRSMSDHDEHEHDHATTRASTSRSAPW